MGHLHDNGNRKWCVNWSDLNIKFRPNKKFRPEWRQNFEWCQNIEFVSLIFIYTTESRKK